LLGVVRPVYIGGDAVKIKTEADSNDMTECPHDDMLGTGMFGFCWLFILCTRLIYLLNVHCEWIQSLL